MSQLLDRIKNLVGGLSREERRELLYFIEEDRETLPDTPDIPDLDLDERCPYV